MTTPIPTATMVSRWQDNRGVLCDTQADAELSSQINLVQDFLSTLADVVSSGIDTRQLASEMVAGWTMTPVVTA